jgi:3-oxoacyl-[acyl-carrier protein] reductase
MPEQEFSGRVALVTGGSRGIGREVCLRLAQSGARVAINHAANEAAAQETKAMIEAKGGSAEVFKARVEVPEAVSTMVQAVEQQFGPVDLLVTSAGILAAKPHTEMTFEGWQRVLRTNVDGTYLPVMAVKDGMIERGYGRIVCITSIAGLRPRPNDIAYSTSKAAVIGFVRSCSEAFAPDVRINAIAPGLIETDMIQAMSPERRAKILAETPLKRIGRPEEIAHYVHFLLSGQSDFTTGQTVVASGGRVTLP